MEKNARPELGISASRSRPEISALGKSSSVFRLTDYSIDDNTLTYTLTDGSTLLVEVSALTFTPPAPPPPSQTDLSITAPSNIAVTEGEELDIEPTISGGVTPYVLTVDNPRLVVDGTSIRSANPEDFDPLDPLANAFSVVITVTDADGAGADVMVDVTINEAPPLTAPNSASIFQSFILANALGDTAA